MIFCCDLKCMLCFIWFGGMALICMCATGVAQQLCSSQREACKWNVFHHPSSAGCLDWLIPPMSRRAWKDRALLGSQFIQFRMLKSDVCMMSVNGMTNAELRVFYYVLSLRSVRRAHGRLLITRRDEHVPFPNSNKNHFRRPHLPGYCRFHLCFCSWKSTLRLG